MICNGRKQLFKPLLLSLEGPALFSAVAEAVCSVPVSESPLSPWGEDGQSLTVGTEPLGSTSSTGGDASARNTALPRLGLFMA